MVILAFFMLLPLIPAFIEHLFIKPNVVAFYKSFFSVNDNFWQNYWSFFGVVLTILAALWGVIHQIEKEQINKFVELQEKFRKEKSKFFLDFDGYIAINSKVLAKNNNYPLFIKLCKELADLIYTSRDIGYRRKRLEKEISKIDDKIDDDFSVFDDNVLSIINDWRYLEIVDFVVEYFEDISAYIDEIRKQQKNSSENNGLKGNEKKSLKEQESEKDINFFDNRILGYWILNRPSAENAKYLIGVSTSDKRILAIYRLNGKTSFNEFTRRILFSAEECLYYRDSKNSKYLNDEESKKPIILDALLDWRAQNPVLYYKQYSESKGIKKSIQNNNLKHFIPEISTLKPRDIIVVRTQKFD